MGDRGLAAGKPTTRWRLAQFGGFAWGSLPDHVFAIDVTTFRHWDGTAWKRISGVANECELHALWGFSESDVWLAGNQAIYHYDGVKLTSQPADAPVINAVWGPSPNVLYAAGQNNVMKYRCKNGPRWRAPGASAYPLCDPHLA